MINMSKTKRRIGSCRNENRVLKGFIYVQASFNNTIVTVTDVRGQVLCWSSIGACGFKGTRRGTPFVAQTAAENFIHTLMDRGMERVEVMISGPGRGRDTTLRTIRRSGILLSFVRDVTPMPHNGCSPPKKRRV
jgi:small subunit ribosomal protein S11